MRRYKLEPHEYDGGYKIYKKSLVFWKYQAYRASYERAVEWIEEDIEADKRKPGPPLYFDADGKILPFDQT